MDNAIIYFYGRLYFYRILVNNGAIRYLGKATYDYRYRYGS